MPEVACLELELLELRRLRRRGPVGAVVHYPIRGQGADADHRAARFVVDAHSLDLDSGRKPGERSAFDPFVVEAPLVALDHLVPEVVECAGVMPRIARRGCGQPAQLAPFNGLATLWPDTLQPREKRLRLLFVHILAHVDERLFDGCLALADVPGSTRPRAFLDDHARDFRLKQAAGFGPRIEELGEACAERLVEP